MGLLSHGYPPFYKYIIRNKSIKKSTPKCTDYLRFLALRAASDLSLRF